METQPTPQQDVPTPANEPPALAPSDTPADSVVDAALPVPGADGSDQQGELTIRQLRLLAALVTSTDVQAACKIAGVSRSAAYLWLKQPAFQDELKRQRNALLREALANVKINATRASAELVGLLDEDDASLRCLVCRDILDRAVRIYDMEEIETRLAAVERTLKQQRGPAP